MKIINKKVTTKPDTEFLVHFAQNQAIDEIDRFIDKLQQDIGSLDTFRSEQQASLRQARRLHREDLNDPMYQKIKTTIGDRCKRIESEKKRINRLVSRTEDFRYELRNQAKVVAAKQKRQLHFNKVMLNEPAPMIETMRQEQQQGMEELEKSLVALFGMMHDAGNYLDAVAEVELSAPPEK